MSTTVDLNILIYASNAADPVHKPAFELLERLAAGPDLFYLFWPTLLGYVRITTHPRVATGARLSVRAATSNLSALLTLPHVRSPGEGKNFWAFYTATARDDTAGRLVPDAQIAALMRENGVKTIYTRDRDFRRFDGIEPVDPFAI